MHNNQRGSQGYSIFQSQYSNNGYSAQDAVQYHGNTNNSNSFVPSNNMHLKKNNYSEGHPYPNSQDISNQNHNQVYHSAGGSNGANDVYNGGHTGRAEGYSQNYNEGVVPHQMQFHQQPSPAMHMQGMQHAYYNNQTTSRSNERFSQEISKSYSGHGDGFEAPYVVEPVYVSSRSFDNRDPSIVSHSPMHSVTASRDSNDRYDPQGLHSYSHLLPHTTSSQSSYEYSSGNYPNHGIQAQLQPYPQTQATIPGSHPPNQQYYGRSVHMSVNPGNVNLGLNNNGGRYRSNPNPSSNYNHQSQYGSGAQGRQGQNNGSTMQGRSLNKMLLDILRDRVINTFRLNSALENTIEKFDCVNIATLLFHTGKKKITLNPGFIGRIAARLNDLSEELRAREASNALYGLRCMSSDCPEVRQLCVALAAKLSTTTSKLVAQAVGNAVYGLQSMTSDHEEVRVLLSVLAVKVSECVETLEAQNVGNALYGLRGMNSDHKEVRDMLTALTPKLMSVRESLNGQAIGNSLYGLQSMCSKEAAVREILRCLANLINDSGDSLNAQEIGNCLYGMKRMFSDAPEVRMLIGAIATKVRMSGELLDAQAVGNALYGKSIDP